MDRPVSSECEWCICIAAPVSATAISCDAQPSNPAAAWQVIALEIDPYLKEFARPQFEESGLAERIEVLVGPASDSIAQLAKQGKTFDIAFIDADKTGYLGYYKQLMDKQMITPGGIIVVDNALMKVCEYPSCVIILFSHALTTGAESSQSFVID